MNEVSYIESYPVGLFSDIQRKRLRQGLRGYVLHQVHNRNWRAVRNYFNGYLAEWHYPPEGVTHHRCGKGWTRKAAIRSLGRHIAEANAPELHLHDGKIGA